LINIQGKATGLSDMLEGEVSHDRITIFLSKELLNSREEVDKREWDNKLAL
jgi:hypothetical protein